MSKPMYQMIAEDLRQQIESGKLPMGTRVPTEVELQQSYNASRNTIRDAIKRLTAYGLVETRPGHGTFVATRIDPLIIEIGLDPASEDPAHPAEVAAQGRRVSRTSPRVEIRNPGQPLLSELGLPPDSQVVSRHHECYVDETPWFLYTVFHLMDTVTRGATRLLNPENIDEGTLAYLRETVAITAETWRASLSARQADEREAAFFGIASARATVVDIRKTYYDQEGNAFCVTVTTYPADRNRFVVTAGIVPASP